MGDHYYTADGQMVEGLRAARAQNAYPGVTTVLKVWPQDGLKKWLNQQLILSAHSTPRLPTESDEEWTERVIACADEDSKRARDTGTRRHAIIEQFNRGQLKIAQHDPIDLAHCQPYFEWFDANVRKVRHAERIVVNKELGYAGTLDLDCIIHSSDMTVRIIASKFQVGPSALVDVKNRKKLAVFDNDVQQLAAYSHCEDCHPDKLISIVLGTERQEILVREWTPEEIDRAWKNFRLCLELWCASHNYYPTKGQP